jgi:flagellar hook-basal body complex protein FliE
MNPIFLDLPQLSEVKNRDFNIPKSSASNAVSRGESVAEEKTSFEELLASSMKEVNALQLESDDKIRKLATGDVEDISEVVLASSRAEVALRMFMELRNKFVDAYQQLSRISA